MARPPIGSNGSRRTYATSRSLGTPNIRSPIDSTGIRVGSLSDEYGLLYINAGSPWLFEADPVRDPILVQPGSIVLLFPDVWHRYRPLFGESHNHSSTLWCHFGGETARRWQGKNLFSPQRPILAIGESPAIESVFRRLHNSVQLGESGLPATSAGGRSAGVAGQCRNGSSMSRPADASVRRDRASQGPAR